MFTSIVSVPPPTFPEWWGQISISPAGRCFQCATVNEEVRRVTGDAAGSACDWPIKGNPLTGTRLCVNSSAVRRIYLELGAGLLLRG